MKATSGIKEGQYLTLPGITRANTLHRMAERNEKLTAADLETARRLRKIWNAKKGVLGLTQAKAGERLGVSQGMVGHYINARKSIPLKQLFRLAKLLQVDPEQLRPGIRQEFGLKEKGTREEKGDYDGGNTEPGPDIRGEHPVISWVQAGDPSIVADPFPPGVSEEWYPCPVPCSEKTFVLRVKGPSMEPEYQEGDLIFVDPEEEPAHNKDVVVRFEDSQEATFKRLVVDNGKYYLKAINPEWPKRYIPIDGEATLCGVVVFSGKIR